MLGLLVGLVLITPLVLAYLLVIKAMDRYEPEPWWLIAVMFLWGAFGATFLALFGNLLGQAAFSLALGARSPLLDGLTASIVAPLVEETTKGLGVFLLFVVSTLWLRELDGPLDGVIYGGMVGLGFTLTEDLLYVANATSSQGLGSGMLVLFLRTVLAGLGHASFTALIGLGFGIAVVARNPFFKVTAPVAGWGAAVLLHALHNMLVSFFGVGGFVLKLAVFWLFDVLFLVLLLALAVRDRSIVQRNLEGEVGRLLHPFELRNTTSLKMFLPLWNFASLSQGGGYSERRRKQLALVELAFLKHRRRRGESGAGLDRDEADLRRRIAAASGRGVFVGAA